MPDLITHLDQLFYAATVAYDEDRFAAAAELLCPYLRHRPRDGYAWFVYGDALRSLGLPYEAERALVRAMELCPGQPWPRVRWAMVKQHLGHRDAAEADYAAVADHPDVARAGWFWIERGSNLAVLGQLAAAERCHRTAIDCEETCGEAYLNLGHVLRATGRYDDAAAAYRSAVELLPTLADPVDALQSLTGVAAAARLAADTPA